MLVFKEYSNQLSVSIKLLHYFWFLQHLSNEAWSEFCHKSFSFWPQKNSNEWILCYQQDERFITLIVWLIVIPWAPIRVKYFDLTLQNILQILIHKIIGQIDISQKAQFSIKLWETLHSTRHKIRIFLVWRLCILPAFSGIQQTNSCPVFLF